MHNALTQRAKQAAAVLLLTGMTACAGGEDGYFPARSGYIEPPQRTEVVSSDMRLPVLLGPGQMALGTEQADHVNAFLARTGKEDGDYVEIATKLNAADPVSRARNARIATDLKQSFVQGGYAPSHVSIVNSAPNDDTIEIRIKRYDVALPDCSLEYQPSDNWTNEPVGVRSLGCSNERNLGLMIADPRDLTGDRELAPAMADREADSVDRYRAGEITPLSTESATGDDVEALSE